MNVQFSLPVSFFREGKYFIAYTPALDLASSGKTFEEAKKRFGEVVGIFFEEIIEKGSFEEVLSELGWSKTKRDWVPPQLIAQESESFAIPLHI